MRTIMITGGMGFIGSNLIRYWMKKYPEDTIINVDALTYAARPEWVDEFTMSLEEQDFRGDYIFEKVDITDHAAVLRVMQQHRPHHVIHLAAESHVCRSIAGPKAFAHTNFLGTFYLIEEFKELWKKGMQVLPGAVAGGNHKFIHVSTDEVFGELGAVGKFDENHHIDPRSPYSATKAASDLIVQAYHETYGLDVMITNCSNNFGPNQHTEKLIPKAITSILQEDPMTVHGQGDHVRDWLFVDDHCSALDVIFHKGKPGHRYCIGGETELTNLEVIQEVHKIIKSMGIEKDLKIIHTNDRPTDDNRYAIYCSKLRALGWNQAPSDFRKNLEHTVGWYISREGKLNVKS